MMQKHLLLRHCLDVELYITAHLITEQITVITIPDFRMNAKIVRLFWLIFYLSSISVIEIGSEMI